MYKYIFWDMDGTLVKSELGVIDSVMYALDKMGVHTDDREGLKKFIGPPLFVSFTEFKGMTPEQAEEAIGYYREFYKKEGIYNSPLFDGVYDLLSELASLGKEMYIVTSKPVNQAEHLAEYLDIRKFMKGISAPAEKNNNPEKKDLMQQVIDEHSESGLGAELKDYIMIGDRHFDICGAVACGIDSIGVLYGYGSEEELREAGTTYIATEVKDIIRFVV